MTGDLSHSFVVVIGAELCTKSIEKSKTQLNHVDIFFVSLYLRSKYSAHVGLLTARRGQC